jgi:actin-related protein
MSEEVPAAIIVDLGGKTVRAGLAPALEPKTVFPNVVGRSNQRSFAGSDVQPNVEQYSLKVKHPIVDGVIDFDSLESVFHHCFYNEMRVAPEEHPILVAECTLSSGNQRERLTQMFFE